MLMGGIDGDRMDHWGRGDYGIDAEGGREMVMGWITEGGESVDRC